MKLYSPPLALLIVSSFTFSVPSSLAHLRGIGFGDNEGMISIISSENASRNLKEDVDTPISTETVEDPDDQVDGCNIDYLNLIMNNYLPTDLTAVSSDVVYGKLDVPGCPENQGGHKIYQDKCWKLPSGNPGINQVNGKTNGGCKGAKGTYTFKPDSDYAAKTGLRQIVLTYKDEGGPNGKTDFKLNFEMPSSKGYVFGDANPAKRDCDNSRKCKIYFDIKVRSEPVTFSGYVGDWALIAVGASITYTAGSSWTETQSSTYTDAFTVGLSSELSMGFNGFGATVGASMESSKAVSKTMESAQTQSWSVSCDSQNCDDGHLYVWEVEATGSDGTTQKVTNCFFQCVPFEINDPSPRCPLTFCASRSCQCCNGVWREDSSDPDDNLLSVRNGGSCEE